MSVERILTEKQVTQIEEEMIEWRKDCIKYRKKSAFLMKWLGMNCVAACVIGFLIGSVF